MTKPASKKPATKPASKKPASKPASKKPASKPAVPKKVDRRGTDVMKILAQEGVSFAKAVKKSPFTKK